MCCVLLARTGTTLFEIFSKAHPPLAVFFENSQNARQKKKGAKTAMNEKTRITVVLAADASGGKLPAMLIFNGTPTPTGETPAANSIEREFKTFEDDQGNSYPRDLVYAVEEGANHSQRVFDNIWMPQVWNQRPGHKAEEEGNGRQPETLLAWDIDDLHQSDASITAMADSNTTLFIIPGGKTPRLQPCDRDIGHLFKSAMQGLYQDHVASPDCARNNGGYPCPPSRGLLAQWVKKSWDDVDADSIRSSWNLAGLLLPFDGSGDEAWAKKKLCRFPSRAT